MNALDRCRESKAACDRIETLTVPVRRDDLARLIALATIIDENDNGWQHADPCRKTRYPRTGPCDCGLAVMREALAALTKEDA